MKNILEDIRPAYSLLKTHQYHKISSTPSVRNLWALPLEPLNILNHLGKRKHMLFEPSAISWLYASFLKFKEPALLDFYTIFFQNRPVSDKVWAKYFSVKTLADFRRNGLLSKENRFIFRFVPYDKLLLVTDRYVRAVPELVYLGKDSIILAEHISKYLTKTGKRFQKGLDLCTGTGILAMVLSRFCAEVTGTDINAHALEVADLNLQLNNIRNVKFIQSDLYPNLEEKYEFIVANPPYRFLPHSVKGSNLDSFGGRFGIEIVCKIIDGLDFFLKPGGCAIFISLAPIKGGRDLLLDYLRNLKANFNIEIFPLSLHIDREYHFFHKRNGISHFSYNLYVIRKEKTKAIKLFSLPFYKRAAYLSYIFSVNLLGALSKRHPLKRRSRMSDG